jgi:aminoglycoside phosphotransferase (APT) family kinase protein
MWREYRITQALAGHYPVPCPRYYASAEDSVIAAEFYVMDRVDGDCLGTRLPADWGFDAQRSRQFCMDFWTHLCKLHELDIDALELQDFGRPQGYIERQIKGWNERYVNALTDDAEPFADVRDWLDLNRPATENAHCIVHGDFRMDNIIVDAAEPHTISAVLDWEISALGDPLMDLGAALVYWIEADDPPQLKVLKKQPSDAPGMLSRREVIAHYANASGRDIDDFTFYYVYGIFRLAVIAQQIYYRYHHGQTSNQAFAMYGPGARALGDYARTMIDKELRL